MMNCDSYLIDEHTLALKSVFNGEYFSKIITTHGIYLSKQTPKDLLNKACLRYGSTKKGRIQAATLLLEFSQKPPFIIGPNEIGVYPTESHKNLECIWIFNHRCTITEVAKKKSILTFMDGTSIQVPVSKHTITNQQQRLHTLMNIIRFMHREKELYTRGKKNSPLNYKFV